LSCHDPKPLPSAQSPAATRRHRFAVVGLLLLPLLTRAAVAEPEIGPPPDWVVVRPWTAPAQPVENPTGEDYLLLDEQSRLATAENYHHNVYQIVSDSGRQHGSQVSIDFDPAFQTLVIHAVNVFRRGEKLDRLDPAKIQVIQQERDIDRQLYNGERSAHLILDDVRLGDSIELAYTLRGRNPVFAGKFIDTCSLEWGVPVRDLHYRVLVPPGRKVGFSRVPARSPDGSGPEDNQLVRQVADETEFSWHRAGLPIIEAEEQVPDSHPVFAYLDLSEFPSWGAVVQWALPLYAPVPGAQPLLEAAAAEIRGKSSSPEQRAVDALMFVQQEIRYLGIEMGPGSHRPSAPEEVLRRRFGDCKDKARLLTALLRQLGLDAAPALVHSEQRELLHRRQPTPYAFDHVIVALDLHRQRYLLDPTMVYQRGASLTLRHVGEYGPYLRIAEDSTDLQDAALGPGDTHRSQINESFTLTDLEKPAEVTVQTVSEGRSADSLRAYFATTTRDQITRDYLDYYNRYYPGITSTQALETNDNPMLNTYTVTEHYRVKQLFARETDSTYLRAEFHPAAVWEHVRTPNLAQRRQPFALSHPWRLDEIIHVRLPTDWKVKAEQMEVSDPTFRTTARISNPSPREVQLEYGWESRDFRVEPTRLAEFSANLAKARKSLGYQLSWNTAPAVPEPAAFSPNWPMLALAASICAGGGYFSRRLLRRPNPHPPAPPLLSPAKPDDPYSDQARHAADLAGLGGWLVLVAIGLVVRPLFLLKTIIGACPAYFNGTLWSLLSDPASEQYVPLYQVAAPLELAINFTLLVYSLLLIGLFFRRSHLFPRAMQVYLGGYVLVALFACWDASVMSARLAKPGDNLAAVKMVSQALGAAFVWIPYFQVSRRVKQTFIR
jgi:hypothetical protein